MLHRSTLLDRLDRAGLLQRTQGDASSLYVDHLAHDSRAIGPDGLFVAIRGIQQDGHVFIDKAVQNGATTIVCEAMPEDADTRFPGIAFVQVANARAALAEAAALYYGDPARDLHLIGVTGTNGKTTTTTLVYHLLTALGIQTGLLGTIENRIADEVVKATHTTPDALAINALLRRMVDADCTACVMEVSSHALDQDRIHGLEFDVAVFTNLTQDHLDYHGSFEAYIAAKKRLFDTLGPEATALYNIDDAHSAAIIADTKAQRCSYGQAADADVQVRVLRNSVEGLELDLNGQERRFPLVGLFNAYNLAAAFSVGTALGHKPEAVSEALAQAPPVPGRFERIAFADGTIAIVDYAHTPDALENVLQTIRATKSPSARLWCLFGCGGDRDPDKRRLMGAIAERFADHVIVTSDNPRTEDPYAILNDIRRGMDRPAEAQWIVDRREAIRTVAHQARPGDVVLVAGKGHEDYQVLGTEKVPFDDREEVRLHFAPRGLQDAPA